MVAITIFTIPVNTVTRIAIAVPEKAEFETAFVKWADRVANMVKQVGCRAIFYAHPNTIIQLQDILRKEI